jgi:hypothetical protein
MWRSPSARGSKPRGGRRAITFDEFKTELAASPEWRARVEARRRELRPIVERNMQDSAPVIADLVATGFWVHSIGG